MLLDALNRHESVPSIPRSFTVSWLGAIVHSCSLTWVV